MFKKNFLGSLCITSFALAQSSRLSLRKPTSPQTYDPYIVCDNMGPRHSEGLPLAYSEQIYAELLSLCSTAHGARENVGCFCSMANSQVHCDQRLADQVLWEARYSPEDDAVIYQFERMGFPNGNMDFPELCRTGCECATEEEAGAWFQQTFDGADISGLVGASGLLQPSGLPGDATQPHDAGPTFAAGSLVGTVQPAAHLGWQNQCGNNCTSSKDCSIPAGGNSTCTCRAHSSQYQPGSGTVAFIAACLVTLGSGGKRDEGLPCPCNSTYVSYSCCDAADGLVWEPPESKLGKLVISTDL